ncbi:Heat shock 70 kDa protein 12A [Entomortierella beljakovae]|nr:Heat shock 70 kDa protein 12A [Entomortierella beljakovae]
MTQKDFDVEDYPIVVAIDFGTTFSGCAFAYAPENGEVRTITEWPRQNIQYAKTPTVSLYEKIGGKLKMVDWGWRSKLKMETPAASKYVQLYKFKPYLDESVALTPWATTVTIPTAISDYLGALHEFVAEKILAQFGPSFSRNSFRYCLTVPAIWSDKAKDVMRQAAIRAKLITEYDHPDRLLLVTEPEAAALYCEKKCEQFNLDHQDRFMICDAGGGTVDLIVYEIIKSKEGRQLTEVTKGHGASCGSMFIDLNLGNLLIEKFTKQGIFDFPRNIIMNLVESFAYDLKPHFDGEDDQYLKLPRHGFFDDIENPGAIGIDGGFMCLSAEELKVVVFEPVVKQVIELIDQQLKSATSCSAIFMVGGFGSSSYLLNRVRAEFKDKVRLISSPYKPEIAVVCGAVYAGLNPKIVTARITRRCYGANVNMPFEEGVDPLRLKADRFDGDWCKRRFSTFVRKGQKVQIDDVVTRTYNFTKLKERYLDNNDFSVIIHAIDGDPPRYTSDPGVSRMASVKFPNPFKDEDPLGHKVKHEVKMYFGLNEIKLEVTIQGSKYSTTLRYE